MVKVNTCVFISGNGTNLKKLILNSNGYNFPIKIKLIVCNNKNAKGLEFAKKWSNPYIITNKRERLSENKILTKLQSHKIELILLAVNINLVSFSIFLNDLNGQIFTLFILTVAAAEAAIGLAIIVVYYRGSQTIRVEEINKLKG